MKPESIFVNGDIYALDNDKEYKKSLEWQMQEFRKLCFKIDRYDLLEEWTRHCEEDYKPEVIMKEGEAIKLMKEIGFKNIELVFRKYTKAVLFARK